MESWSLQLRNGTKMSPQLKSFFFFHRPIYSLCLVVVQNLGTVQRWDVRGYLNIDVDVSSGMRNLNNERNRCEQDGKYVVG